MNEYYEFRSKRIKELDETFEITHFYGDDYPENIYVEVNKIINNEWKLNSLQSKIDKAIEYCEYNDEDLYTFEPDYDYEENMVDNYEPSNFREELLDILKEDK